MSRLPCIFLAPDPYQNLGWIRNPDPYQIIWIQIQQKPLKTENKFFKPNLQEYLEKIIVI